MTLHIHKLTAENYKRLRAVEITVDGPGIVTISGRNAQGKSSVLDAIWAALAGREASRATAKPIREGADEAKVTVDLGDYVVTRRWTSNNAGTLTVTAADGARYSSPQKLLDDVIGANSFDPLAFTRMTAREQRAALLDLVELPFDLDAMERTRQQIFENRTDTNREADRLEAHLKSLPVPVDDLPVEPESVSLLLTELNKASEHNAMLDGLERARVAAEAECTQARSAVARAREALDNAEVLLQDAESKLRSRTALIERAPASIDEAEIQHRLSMAAETNAAIEQARARMNVAVQAKATRASATEMTAQLAAIERDKAAALSEVQFPVVGLGFDDTGVTFRGVPFSQASAAEQLRVSVALAMAANPTLRVLRIVDGSLLDKMSMGIIESLAREHDYQVWVEVVSDGEPVGFTIEDGEIQ